jgi:RNA polymerase sigma factor (sigma-70 family)
MFSLIVYLDVTAANQASAWQQWQHSHHNNFNTNRMDYVGPSFMYLDNYDPSGHENSSGDGRSRGKPKIDKANKTKKIQTNLSFHNYPRHIAPHVDKSQDINEKKRRRRSRLASRSTASAILPTKQRRTKQCTESNLLTFEEETEIAYAIQAYATAMRIKDDLCTWMSKERNSRISGLNKVPSEEHWASACSLTVAELHDVIQRGQEARAKLVAGNVGLVTVIAKKYYHLIKGGAVNGYNPNNTGGTYGVGGTLKLDDLIQEGYIGIMDAAERFDPERGFRFSTYGSYWVRQRILRSISESSRIIRLPEHVQTMVSEKGCLLFAYSKIGLTCYRCSITLATKHTQKT